MKRLLSAALLLGAAFFASAQGGELHLNGMAPYSQLRKEYYIGGLYLGGPAHDAAAISNMPGKKRMELRITADRWPPLRFAQQWNQLILINNDGGLLNANVEDVLAFTGLPKSDLMEGDQLVIEFEPDAGTSVSLNGTTVVHTASPALFTMLLNTWIGPRPPSSEFKRDMLSLPGDKAAAELAARFDATAPNEARKKLVAGWAAKPEPEPVAAAKAKPAEPVAAARIEPQPKPHIENKPESKPVPVPAPVRSVAADSPKSAPEAAPAPTVAQQQAREEREKKQRALYNEYLNQVRKLVNKNTEYPRRAIKEGLEGLVVVRVQLDHLGNLVNLELVQSAHEILDRAAQNAVKSAQPFPAAGDQLEGSDLQFLVPIVFKLTR